MNPRTLAGAIAGGVAGALVIGGFIALGLLVGEIAVLVTVLLHCLTLMWGGTSDWRSLVVLTLPPHLVIAAVEGVVLGFAVSFLARVKPELLRGGVRWENSECHANA